MGWPEEIRAARVKRADRGLMQEITPTNELINVIQKIYNSFNGVISNKIQF